jgi:4-hydroxy-tetrahydrodipicolinate synthase
MHAPVTPMTADGRVDSETTGKLIDFLVRHGSAGVCVTLHVGEGPNLTLDERKTVLEAALEGAAGRVPVLSHISMAGTDQTVELARHAERAGAAAVVVLPPYYWRPSDESLLRHFEAISQAIEIPFILYTLPSREMGVSPETIAEMARRFPNFIGVKEASHDWEKFLAIRTAAKEVRPDFAMTVGVEYLLPVMVMGGLSCYSIIGAVAPRLLNGLYRACAERDLDRALELQTTVGKIHKMFRVEYPAPIKAAMEIMGRPCGKTRLPIVPLDAEKKAILRGRLEELGILEQEPHGW